MVVTSTDFIPLFLQGTYQAVLRSILTNAHLAQLIVHSEVQITNAYFAQLIVHSEVQVANAHLAQLIVHSEVQVPAAKDLKVQNKISILNIYAMRPQDQYSDFMHTRDQTSDFMHSQDRYSDDPCTHKISIQIIMHS